MEHAIYFRADKSKSRKKICTIILTSLQISQVLYSGANWKVYEHCLIKQKSQIQMDIAQNKDVAMPVIGHQEN